AAKRYVLTVELSDDLAAQGSIGAGDANHGFSFRVRRSTMALANEPDNARESLIRARSSNGLDGQTDAAHTGVMKIPLAHDPLGEALHFLRMSGVFYCRSEFTAPWALDLPPFEDCLMFHVVTSGRCVLEVKDSEDHVLQPGDFALVPHGAGHRLASELGIRGAKLFDLPREQVSDRYEILRHGEGGASTTVICGVVRFDHPAADRLVTLLPPVIAVDAWSSPEVEWIQSTLRLMAIEARELRPGGETVITRLADILVIQAIRSWIA